MTMRQATLIIADDFSYHLNGKINLHGVYTGDIVLPSNAARMNQLVFLFILECDPENVPKFIDVNVTLPSGQFVGDKTETASLNADESDRVNWTLRTPILFQGAILTPGSIKATVKYDDIEIPVSAPLIRTAAIAPTSIAIKS